MIGRTGTIAIGAASVIGLAALDLASKAHARSSAPDVAEVDAEPTPGLRWVHHEHPGPRGLGVAVAAVPALVGAAAAYGVTRAGGSRAIAVAGAVALGAGAVLNGAELIGRGSNTNPWSAFGIRFNAADVAVVAGAGLLAAGALPIVVRALVR